ncbi:MAG TPA: retropepsin-like aspartic protease [Gemmatimonadaceae bacterium]
MLVLRRGLIGSAVLVLATLGAAGGPHTRRPPVRALPDPTCAAPSVGQPAPAADSPNWPDWLLREHRYVAVADWMTTAGTRPGVSPEALVYVRGVLANKQNQNAASIRTLEPLLARLDPVADSARVVVVLKTLADDYLKTYRYGDAALALDRIVRQYGATMTATDRTDLQNDIELRRALRSAPPQRTTVSSPFTIPLRPDALGLREVMVHVGRDSSGWIFDTGANLSTITEGMARRLGLHVLTSGATTKGITGASVPNRLAVIPEMRFGGARVRNAVVLVLPDSALDVPQVHFQITAILGYPVLESLGRLAIGTARLGVDLRTGESATDSSNLFLDNLSPLVAAKVGDSTRLFHFDSGADATLLTVRFCRAYTSLLAGLDTTSIGIGGAGGAQRYVGYRLSQLPVVIGGQRAELDSVFVLRDSTRSPFESYFGNLAGNLAGRFGGYTMDFRAMTFRLGAEVR